MFHTIATHVGAHRDELYAIRLLRKHGEKRFPGISTAKVVYWRNAAALLNGRTAKQLEAEGVLLLGIGGGQLDEHASKEGERKDRECCATLVAKVLGLRNDPRFERILDVILADDTVGAKDCNGLMELSTLINSLNRHPGYSPEQVEAFANMAFDAVEREQQLFLDALEEVRRVGKEYDLPGMIHPKTGRKARMVVVQSDAEAVNRAARSEIGGGFAVVIQRNSSGNTQVFTDKSFRISMEIATAMLRQAEVEVRWNMTIPVDRLVGEKVDDGGIWYLHPAMQVAFNGSLTHPGVPPTKLNLVTVAVIVQRYVEQETTRGRKAPRDASWKVIMRDLMKV